ncbi:MAG: BrnT family toxin [Chloroflexota bacterium]|nr:MAG: BrnT family toxin [Chloroflexota bacterium]
MSRYDWDQEKARVNLAKHGVSFEDAETVPGSGLARWAPDPLGHNDSARFVITGYSARGVLLVVVTSEHGPRPRIISARRATKREQHAYEARP